jgi:hypothetical protein
MSHNQGRQARMIAQCTRLLISLRGLEPRVPELLGKKKLDPLENGSHNIQKKKYEKTSICVQVAQIDTYSGYGSRSSRRLRPH